MWNSSEKPFKTKVGWNIPYGYSRSTILAFDGKQNKHDVHGGKACMKKNCELLRKPAIKIINFRKK